MWYEWRPYVSAGQRRRNAEREMKRLAKQGHPVSPVVIDGRTIASTFWGKAWCSNLECYRDFENRLPRGRTYVRNGSVVDLQIAPGAVTAMVSGSDIYNVTVNVAAVPKARWSSICRDCAGAIDSLVELLQGRFSKGVMERICQQKTGLFPAPAEIEFSCSCPDWASMCKHVAAVLYGIGARLDEQPELLFQLRKVDEKDLIATAGKGLPLSQKGPSQSKVLKDKRLSELFGLELGDASGEAVPVKSRTRKKLPARGRQPKRAPSAGGTVTAPKPRKVLPSSAAKPTISNQRTRTASKGKNAPKR